MTFVPPKPRFLLEKKRTSLPLITDIPALQASLLASVKDSFPDLKSNLPSMQREPLNTDSLFSEEHSQYASLTERAKRRVSEFERVKIEEARLIPSRQSTNGDSSAFITNPVLEDEEKEKERIQQLKIKALKLRNPLIKEDTKPQVGSEVSVGIVNGLLKTVWDVDGIKNGIQQAKEGIYSYGAELREMRDKLRSINKFAIDKLDTRLDENLIVAMENTFRRMEESSHFKFGKIIHKHSETVKRLQRYRSVDRGLQRNKEKLELPQINSRNNSPSLVTIFPRNKQRSKPHFINGTLKDNKMETLRGFLKPKH